ncbi:MAG: radical SAM family heme chaperone HemW, partial [Prevotellaceae bacterium]|nr:radical SAM family heme chaperone HemW [Prevotellaceae bacterium]
DFEQIFAQINRLFDTKSCEEITIEANPDDVSEEYLAMLRRFPLNRISIGIQSFNDNELRFLNRRHNKEQAIKAVERCRQAGFKNLSIDLIYGLPLQTEESWQNSLQAAIALNVEHISAYHLTYEPQTVLGKMLADGKVTPASEETALAQFSILINTLKNNGFEHYEISNFARKGYRSKHNSAYWQGKYYLGIGPSAHSYDGDSRQWNVADIKQYIQNTTCFEREELTPTDKYNDYIITALRTAEGIDVSKINRQFGKDFADYCRQKAQPFIQSGKLALKKSEIKTTDSGIFISDYIMEKLMFIS